MATKFRVTYEDGSTSLVELEVRAYQWVPELDKARYELWIIFPSGREIEANRIFDEPELIKLDGLVKRAARYQEEVGAYARDMSLTSRHAKATFDA